MRAAVCRAVCSLIKGWAGADRAASDGKTIMAAMIQPRELSESRPEQVTRTKTATAPKVSEPDW